MSDEKKVKASKVVMAKTLAKISLIEVPLFMLRRGLKQIKGKNALQNTGKIIVLDWDETICKVNTAEELLKAKYGNKLGHEKYEYFRGLVKQGKASLEEAMLLGAKELTDWNIRPNHYKQLIDRLEAEGKIRTEILDAAKYLKRIGRTVVIATKSSQTLADLAAKRYGFDFGIGTRENIQGGKIIGTAELIGDAESVVKGIKVTTKMSRLKQEFKARGWEFSPKNVTILSDGYDDIAIFKKAGFSVLLTPENSGTTQKISQKFKLRDYEVKERPGMGKELKFVMRWPWVVKAKKKRLAEALKKLNRKYR